MYHSLFYFLFQHHIYFSEPVKSDYSGVAQSLPPRLQGEKERTIQSLPSLK